MERVDLNIEKNYSKGKHSLIMLFCSLFFTSNNTLKNRDRQNSINRCTIGQYVHYKREKLY